MEIHYFALSFADFLNIQLKFAPHLDGNLTYSRLFTPVSVAALINKTTLCFQTWSGQHNVQTSLFRADLFSQLIDTLTILNLNVLSGFFCPRSSFFLADRLEFNEVKQKRARARLLEKSFCYLNPNVV